ncbi:restriction endonuclease subunit S [Porphyromonas endodontalis]
MAKNHKIAKCPPLRFPQFNDEWKQTTLGSYFKVQGGYAFKSEYYRLSGIPIIRISNLPMDRRYIDLRDCVYYPSKFNIDNQFKVQKGDLLIAMSGATTGKTSIYNYNRFSYLNQRVGLFRPIARNVFYPILYAYVESDNFKLSLGKLLIAGAQPNISSSDIEGIPFPVFSLAEQEKIASFLSLIDERIQSCSETIKERKREKAALLNQLFSQKLRFPQFSDEWQVTIISKLCKVSTGSMNTQDKVEYGQYPFYIRSAAIERANRYTYEGVAILTPGDGVIGKIFHYAEGKIAVHQRVYILSDIKVNAKYLYQYFSARFHERVIRMSAKNTVDSIRMNMITDMSICVPTLAEQKKIADFLSLIDECIEVEEELLEQYERQKRYLLKQMFI